MMLNTCSLLRRNLVMNFSHLTFGKETMIKGMSLVVLIVIMVFGSPVAAEDIAIDEDDIRIGEKEYSPYQCIGGTPTSIRPILPTPA
jgi:hypothetical protein